MTEQPKPTATEIDCSPPLPTFSTSEDGAVQIAVDGPEMLMTLFNVKTAKAASGLMTCALTALGRNGENYRDMMAAMQAEMKPRDAVEAMLIIQMTATHVAMTSLSQKMMDASSGYQVREALERSMTRLSRTYLSQMDAFRKYRTKTQQTVRVERVNVENGAQAIIGDIRHGGISDDEK